MTEEPTESIVMPAIKLIVGLGNPGRRYARTRHNIGFMVVDELARRLGGRSWRDERLASVTGAQLGPSELVLIKPQTFMNLSGHAVTAYASRAKAKPAGILVVSDDLDLPFGRLRMRPGGSTGGHNGLRSIAAELETQNFARLRVGIGRPEEGDPIEFVLAPFGPAEASDLPKLCDVACDMIVAAVESSLLVAMNRFNGRASVLDAPTVADPEAAPSPDRSTSPEAKRA